MVDKTARLNVNVFAAAIVARVFSVEYVREIFFYPILMFARFGSNYSFA